MLKRSLRTMSGTKMGDIFWRVLGSSSLIARRGHREKWNRAGGLTGTLPQLESLEPRLLMTAQAALTPQLLKDTDLRAAVELDSNPDSFVVLNDRAIFAATNATSGRELWITDGTSDGTRLLKDVQPGEVSSAPQNLVKVGNSVFFTANDGSHGRELWKTDGTDAGTVLVADLNAGGSGTNFLELVDSNGTAFLATEDSLFRSDGTEAGTTLVQSGLPGIAELTVFQGDVFFATTSGLMRSNGTAAGTTLVSSLRSVAELAATSTTLFFKASRNNTDVELFKSDGTDAGTVRVKDINPSGPSNPTSLRLVGNQLYFLANDGSHGIELWTSNGVGTGTKLVTDLTPGIYSNPIKLLGDLNGQLCFWAANFEIGFTDGTAAGTRMLTATGSKQMDLNATPTVAVRFGNRLIFNGWRNGGANAIWSTDGTNAGTLRLSYSNGGSPGNLIALGSQVVFTQSDATQGRELWTTNGTVAGTKLLKDINSDGTRGVNSMTEKAASLIGQPVEANGKLFFLSSDAIGRLQVWQSNGTSAGANQVTNLIGSAQSLVAAANRAFFVESRFDAATNTTSYAVWCTDGFKTTVLRSSTQSPQLGAANGLVYISTGDSLWQTNGTVAGTKSLLSGLNIRHLTTADSNLFFTEINASSGERLMRWNGTAAVPLTDFHKSSLMQLIAPQITTVGNRMLFLDLQNHLRSSDGTVAGTIRFDMVVSKIVRIGMQVIVFNAQTTASFPAAAYITDGTVAGTRMISDAITTPVADGQDMALWINGEVLVYQLGTRETTTILAGDNNRVFGRNATGLVIANHNTGETTTLLGLPTTDKIVTSFLASDGRFYFTTTNDVADTGQLWTSDGTAAGTVMLRAFQRVANTPNRADEDIPFGEFSEVNGRVIVPVQNAAYGFEPWVISPQTPVEITLPTSGVSEFSLVRDGADAVLKQGATILHRVALSSLDQLTLVGSNRSETLTIDYSAGNPLPLEFRFQAAGTGDTDRLVIKGGTVGDVKYSPSGLEGGSLTLDRSTVQFSGLTLIDNQLAASRQLMTFTPGKDNLTLQDDLVANNSRSQLLRGPVSLTFTHPTSSLAFQLGGGADTLRVNGIDASATGFLQIDAGDGDDTIIGGRLPLFVIAGTGNDSVTGGSANDTIVGGAGNDSLSGGDGNDSIDGGDGDDLLLGGAGNDTLLGSTGNDRLAGGDGNDLLNAHSGNNTILGGTGNDTLLATSGNDIALGGDGDDSINAGGGQDTVTGGGNGTAVSIADVITDIARDIRNDFTLNAPWAM